MPRALVDAHVAGCLALQRQAEDEAAGGGASSKAEQKQQRPQSPAAAAAAEMVTRTTTTTTTPASEQQQQQPLRPLSQVLRPQRLGSTLDAAAPPPASQQQQRGSGGGWKRTASAAAAATSSKAALAPPPLSQQAPPQPPAAAAAAAAGSSAFAELMRAQRLASTAHVFYLGELFLFFPLLLFSFSRVLLLKSASLFSFLFSPLWIFRLLLTEFAQRSEGKASSGTGVRCKEVVEEEEEGAEQQQQQELRLQLLLRPRCR